MQQYSKDNITSLPWANFEKKISYLILSFFSKLKKLY